MDYFLDSPPTGFAFYSSSSLCSHGWASRKVARYLNWLGHHSEIFNVGNYRRKVAGAEQPNSFFDPAIKENLDLRNAIADSALDDVVTWFKTIEEKEQLELEQFRDSVAGMSMNSTSPTAFLNHSVLGKPLMPLNLSQADSFDSPDIKKSGNSFRDSHSVSSPIEIKEDLLAKKVQEPQEISSVSSSTPAILSSVRRSLNSPLLGPKIAVKKSLVGSAHVAIYDATNSTIERRKMIIDRLEKENIQIMFVEIICDKMDVIMANITEVKLSSPDYVNTPPDIAARDFMSRIQHYTSSYHTLEESENNGKISFVKLINIGERVLVNNVRGYIQSRIVYFLMNLNISPGSIYFSRHGESVFNVEGKIGGDSFLSPRGAQFASKLPEFMSMLMEKDAEKNLEAERQSKEMKRVWEGWLNAENIERENIPNVEDSSKSTDSEAALQKPSLTIWTSTLKRTIQTASHLNFPQLQWKALDELDSGVCDGLTYEEIEAQYPEDFVERDNDKYNYRYKGGESYADLVRRLEPVTLELERHHEKNHNILIVGHQAVLRALYAYFLNYTLEELPYLEIPLHTIVKLTFKAYGCIEERFKVPVEAVDTHRPRASPMRYSYISDSIPAAVNESSENEGSI